MSVSNTIFLLGIVIGATITTTLSPVGMVVAALMIALYLVFVQTRS